MAKLSDIDKFIKKKLESKEILETIGEIAVESIKKRTRLGRGVKENGGASHKLPILKEKTVTNRKALKRSGQLTGKGATPRKSGLNQTGELLDSIDYKVKSKSVEISVGNDQERKAENVLSISPNFSFMKLSKAELNRVFKEVSQVLGKLFSKSRGQIDKL